MQAPHAADRAAPSSSSLEPPLDGAIRLQPGLIVCHTTAMALGAVAEERAFPGDHEYIHVNCQLAGSLEGTLGRYRLDYVPGQGSIGFSAGECFRLRHCAQFQNLAVMLTPAALRELAGDEVCERLGGGLSPDFFARRAGLRRDALHMAGRVVGLMAAFPQQRLLLHAAVLDYLHRHFASFQPRTPAPALSARECERIEAARALLLRDLSAPPTIAELARAVGINQCKLKAGFRQCFGSSIYALFQKARMDRARQLLQTHNVTETAMLLGYSNMSHFSAAFHKQFACPPSRAAHLR